MRRCTQHTIPTPALTVNHDTNEKHVETKSTFSHSDPPALKKTGALRGKPSHRKNPARGRHPDSIDAHNRRPLPASSCAVSCVPSRHCRADLKARFEKNPVADERTFTESGLELMDKHLATIFLCSPL